MANHRADTMAMTIASTALIQKPRDGKPPSSHRRRGPNLLAGMLLLALGALLLLSSGEDDDGYRALPSVEVEEGGLSSSFAPSRHSNPTVPRIKFYVKTSGQEPYIGNANLIAETWGRDILEKNYALTFLSDEHNPDGVEALARKHPLAAVERIPGTECQGEYKVDGGNRKCAFRAQRLKVRALFDRYSSAVANDEEEATSRKEGSDAFNSWLCYLDDDVVVNVDNLVDELKGLAEGGKCQPDCFVGDVMGFNPVYAPNITIHYAAGGWCMSRPLARRVHDTLISNTDKDLGWKKNDDVDFLKWISEQLNVRPRNSERWYSENSRPVILEGSSNVGERKIGVVVKESRWWKNAHRDELKLLRKGSDEEREWMLTLSVGNLHHRGNIYKVWEEEKSKLAGPTRSDGKVGGEEKKRDNVYLKKQ